MRWNPTDTVLGRLFFTRSFVLLYHDLADVSNAPVENFREGRRACPPLLLSYPYLTYPVSTTRPREVDSLLLTVIGDGRVRF